MFSSINIDTIISDPWLLTASVLLVAGPILFLFAFIRFLMTPKDMETPFPLELESPLPTVAGGAAKFKTPPPPMPVENKIPLYEPEPIQAAADMEKTVVLPAGVSDVQAQLEIALTQIKTINRKIHDIESEVAKIGRLANVKLENAEWKEPPTNAAEFAQKLLKLAEHVIVLEKDVARIKIDRPLPPAPSATPGSKPPIMPL